MPNWLEVGTKALPKWLVGWLSCSIISLDDQRRFLPGELVRLRSSCRFVTPALEWWLNDTRLLGRGARLDWVVDVSFLYEGSEVDTIYLKRFGIVVDQIKISVFSDLVQLYESEPDPVEIARIKRDFNFVFKDGDPTLPTQQWSTYQLPIFNQASLDPSPIAAYAKLDVLRHQIFKDPSGQSLTLPFANGKTVYEYVKDNIQTIELRLDGGFNTGSRSTTPSGIVTMVSFNRSLSSWTQNAPPPGPLEFYDLSLGLFMHEARHCAPSDPLHYDCTGTFGGGFDKDKDIDQSGSGYAQQAIYLMWVYKYGFYDPNLTHLVRSVRFAAKNAAQIMLRIRFCNRPQHSDPKVQAIIDELLPDWSAYYPPP
jgi:hypothetical protein